MIKKSTGKSTTKRLARRKAGIVKSRMTGATVLGALCFLACADGGKNRKDEAYHYKEPRNIGFTLEDWLKEHPEAKQEVYRVMPPVKSNRATAEMQMRLEAASSDAETTVLTPVLTPSPTITKNLLAGSPADPPGAPYPAPRFWGVLDIDYDYQEVVYVNNYPYTPVRILRVLEVFEDIRPPLAPVEGSLPARVEPCIGEGVCRYGLGNYGLLWSGVNLVFGEYKGGCCDKDVEPYLYIL